MRRHQFADERVGQVAAAIDHDDIAGLGHVERLVHHEIVAGPGLDRQRGPGEHARFVNRPQRRPAGGHARHRVADIGDGQRAEPGDDAGIDLARALANPESDHREPSLSFLAILTERRCPRQDGAPMPPLQPAMSGATDLPDKCSQIDFLCFPPPARLRQPRKKLREKSKFMSGFSAELPVQSFRRKYLSSAFRKPVIVCPPSRLEMRGVSRSSRT